MTNFAAIRGLFINRGFGSHFISVSLLLKKGCSSSGPVRFIPGQFSGIKKTRKLAFGNSESNHASVNNESNHASGSSNLDGRSLQNSHFDDDSHIGGPSRIEEYNEAARGDIDYENELNTISMDVGDEPAREDTDYENKLNTISMAVGDGLEMTREEIEQVAVGLLATRAMTAPELQKKLRGKKCPFHIVESIIVDFKARGILNDSVYAESFTRSRWLSSAWGPRRIKHALRQKGVSEIETERARKHVFEDVHDAPEEGVDGNNMRLGMCKLSMDRLFVQASKQWLRSQNTCTEKRRARMVRWLQYRGFDWDVTSSILRRLESQHPA
ncbi:hypothetical protein KSP39_PZI023084 [Platanthera zijinensis]|uniref:Regulatory protein RecX n=1 Tax=Platanthera zijinensis TaxID=2320716 RepID=A0AAP0AWT3_9ASPA